MLLWLFEYGVLQRGQRQVRDLVRRLRGVVIVVVVFAGYEWEVTVSALRNAIVGGCWMLLRWRTCWLL